MKDFNYIIRLAQNGDLSAFEQLVENFQNRVYSLSFKLMGNHEDAQDLAQETFIRAYKSLNSFRFDADFGTWLHRICVNLSINQHQKNKRNPILSIDRPVEHEGEEVYREVAATTEDPQLVYERQEFKAFIQKALYELTDEHRTVLVLREMLGYSYEEIAQMTDCTLGTVKSRINRARQVLRDRISLEAAQAGIIISKYK